MDLSLPEHASRYLRSIRGSKRALTPNQGQGVSIELEPNGLGGTASCATLFLTGAECKLTCSMCDLWQYTLDDRTSSGSLPAQIDAALHVLGQSHEKVDWLKLYNASNFLDGHGVPIEDLAAIAERCRPYSRIIVENHPTLFRSALVRDRTLQFAHALSGTLEIAMGLESIRPESMRLLNKQMTLEDFATACEVLIRLEIDVRAFVLLQPPGDDPSTSVDWSVRACEFAWKQGVRHCSIIPTRPSSGWTQAILDAGWWQPPTAHQLESAMEVALERKPNLRSIVTVDLWDWASMRDWCELCSEKRRERLHRMNLSQQVEPGIACERCVRNFQG